MKVIDKDLQELQQNLGQNHKLTPYQLEKVRQAMADYALGACMDPAIWKEAEDIACHLEKRDE